MPVGISLLEHAMKLSAILCAGAVLTCLSAPLARAAAQARVVEKPVRVLLPPGFVSQGAIIRFEDMGPLSPAMEKATALLRAGKYDQAIEAFVALQRSTPTDPLAFRGEVHAAYRKDSLADTIQHFTAMLSHAKVPKQKAVLHYALGDAIMVSRLGKGYVGEDPQNLGPEPKEHFLEALRLDPKLVVAHFALGIYYEHRSQMKGTLARKHYDAALALRPDLEKQIRFLHALTWDRPGYAHPQEIARQRAMGWKIPEDEMMMPEKAIAECKQLVKDFPDYWPAYERIAQDYEWPLGNKEMAAKYRQLAAAAKERAERKAGK